MFLVHLLLSLGQKTLSTLVLLNLNLGGWNLFGAITVHGLHFRLAGLRSSLLLFLLIFENCGSGTLVLKGFDLS